jgi:hypothetical protein
MDCQESLIVKPYSLDIAYALTAVICVFLVAVFIRIIRKAVSHLLLVLIALMLVTNICICFWEKSY